MRKKKETILLNQKFNLLTIISFSHSDKRFRKWYNVRCDCGNEKKIMGSAMVSNNTKSCGCQSSRFRREHNVLPNNLAVKRQILLGYKCHARDRRIDFNISESDFIELLSKPCHYCGIGPSNIKKTKYCKEGFTYSGIDRVNSSIGYNKENCVPCCDKCNKAKLAMTKEEFLEWVKAVYKHSCQ
jgi:hypothetical protein